MLWARSGWRIDGARLTKSDKTRPGKTTPLAGGVSHDARGNAVWQWASETARHAAVSTSQLLRRLNVASLSLQDDAKPRNAPAKPSPAKPSPATPSPIRPAATGTPAAPARKTQAGFNPYDAGAMSHAAAGENKQSTAPVPARRSWWRRLFQRR
jgi:hypothetical protein